MATKGCFATLDVINHFTDDIWGD